MLGDTRGSSTMSNEAEAQLAQIEITIEEAKDTIATSDAYLRLIKNKDFKHVIQKAYFEEESVRCVLMRSMPNFDSDHQQARILRDIDGIGSLRQFFISIQQKAQMSVNAMDAAAEAREEILAEDVGE